MCPDLFVELSGLLGGFERICEHVNVCFICNPKKSGHFTAALQFMPVITGFV